MRKILLSIVAALFVASLAYAQFGGILFETPVSDFTFNDENALILVKYTGTEDIGTVDINVNAFEFFVGAEAAAAAPTDGGAADVNIGDVCGTAAGALDVTDAECNTFGELVRVINANTDDHGWVAVLVGALDTETIAGATDFIDPADSDAKVVGGYAIRPDSSVHDELPGLFAPWINQTYRSGGTLEGKLSIEPFLTQGAPGAIQFLKGNPVSANRVPFVQRFTANQNSAAADLFEIYSLTYGSPGFAGFAVTGGNAHDGVPTSRLVYSVALADDTQLDSSVNYLFAPLAGDPGTVLLIRANAATAGTLTDTDDELNFHGFYGRLPQ